MCRSTTENVGFSAYSRDRDRLKIRAFHLRFSISPSSSPKLPETLTLVYSPRLNGNPLEINGAKIRADLPSFVALHRARSMDRTAGEAVYASTDRVRAGEAVRFEAYIGSEKAIKGVFRKSGGRWGLECKSEVDMGKFGILGAEVCVGGERGILMSEKVKLSERRKTRFCLKLEEIVEEREREGCDCCSCFREEDEELDEDEGESEKREMIEVGHDDDDGDEENEMEGAKWAMEMGIWAVCVGVGYLVSKASYKGLRRRRII